MANDQKTAKIRAALGQLDKGNDKHWTDDGLPRETVVRTLSSEPALTRKEIQDAWPGFQRPKDGGDTAGYDPLSGEPLAAAASAEPVAAVAGDPAKNEGELMTEGEVHALLEARIVDGQERVTRAQQGVREAQQEVVDAVAALQASKVDYAREYPPKTANQNVKEYIASELAQRAAAHGHTGLAPGSQIDMAMQRSNSRGWRRPTRAARPTQTGAQAPNA